MQRILSSIALYGNTCKLRLPIKSIEEEFKVLHAREMLQLRESSDPKVSGAEVAEHISLLPLPEKGDTGAYPQLLPKGGTTGNMTKC